MRRSTALMAAAAAAALLLLLLVSSSLAVASMSTGEKSEEVETRRIFRDWMAKHKKTYSSIDEEEHRYAVFKKKLRRRYGNRNGATDASGVPIPYGLNVFGDRTDEELGSLHTGCSRSEPQFYSLYLQWRNLLRWVFPGGRDQAV